MSPDPQRRSRCDSGVYSGASSPATQADDQLMGSSCSWDGICQQQWASMSSSPALPVLTSGGQLPVVGWPQGAAVGLTAAVRPTSNVWRPF
jgi:hypothetical protein